MKPTTETPEPTWLLPTTLVVSLILSICCLVRLWRHRDGAFELIFWGLMIWVPVLGPVLFLAFFHPPFEKSPGNQASVNRDAFYGS
jgi:hypothetical protein